jgi:hypothetical protein
MTVADGFSEASVDRILSFLNSEDITCDRIIQVPMSSPTLSMGKLEQLATPLEQPELTSAPDSPSSHMK